MSDSQFIAFARACGLTVDYVKSDGAIHRCGTESAPRGKNGAYRWDGLTGWVMDWSLGEQLQTFRSSGFEQLSAKKRAEYLKAQELSKEAQNRLWKEAAIKAQETIDRCTPSKHYYLNAKCFPDMLGLVDDNKLIIPMRHIVVNKLQGVQTIEFIDGKYVKKMSYGMRAKEAVFFFGNRGMKEFIFCEGYGTGLSIKAAIDSMRLDMAVIVCFSAANMVCCANAVKPLLRGRKAFVFADNDASNVGETAAIKTGLPYIMAPDVGDDANDVHYKSGIAKVCELINNVRTKK